MDTVEKRIEFLKKMNALMDEAEKQGYVAVFAIYWKDNSQISSCYTCDKTKASLIAQETAHNLTKDDPNEIGGPNKMATDEEWERFKENL